MIGDQSLLKEKCPNREIETWIFRFQKSPGLIIKSEIGTLGGAG